MSQHNNHNNHARRDLPVIRYKIGTIPEIVIRSEGWPGIMRVPLSNAGRVI